MIDELRALLSQIEGGKQPENDELYTEVVAELRKQYNELRNIL